MIFVQLINGKVIDLDIKNRTCYYNDLIDIKDFD